MAVVGDKRKIMRRPIYEFMPAFKMVKFIPKVTYEQSVSVFKHILPVYYGSCDIEYVFPRTVLSIWYYIDTVPHYS